MDFLFTGAILLFLFLVCGLALACAKLGEKE
jgi:hypothetical protein